MYSYIEGLGRINTVTCNRLGTLVDIRSVTRAGKLFLQSAATNAIGLQFISVALSCLQMHQFVGGAAAARDTCRSTGRYYWQTCLNKKCVRRLIDDAFAVTA